MDWARRLLCQRPCIYKIHFAIASACRLLCAVCCFCSSCCCCRRCQTTDSDNNLNHVAFSASHAALIEAEATAQEAEKEEQEVPL